MCDIIGISDISSQKSITKSITYESSRNQVNSSELNDAVLHGGRLSRVAIFADIRIYASKGCNRFTNQRFRHLHLHALYIHSLCSQAVDGITTEGLVAYCSLFMLSGFADHPPLVVLLLLYTYLQDDSSHTLKPPPVIARSRE